MPRKYSASQIRSMLRQADAKRRQAINKYNQDVRRHNQQVKRAVDSYNSAVRSYNARVRSQKQRLQSEWNRLQSRRSPVVWSATYRTSVEALHGSYNGLRRYVDSDSYDPQLDGLVEGADRETANSIAVANVLEGTQPAHDTDAQCADANDEIVVGKLDGLSPDLRKRWQGAVFALNPRNPDAARHFCTSAREIVTEILELKAPDDVVLDMPGVKVIPSGKPSRRSKIDYCLAAREVRETSVQEFVESDVENIIELFRVFNDGTHGSAGHFSPTDLLSIKTRVQDGIDFLANL